MRSLVNLNSLTDHLVRPPKFTYSLNDLGPSIFDLHNRIYERIDFNVVSSENKKIQASLWRVKDLKGQNQPQKIDFPVLIYLHCNCGSRVQAMQFVNKALELGYIFVAYDSRGCGHSQGEYISLGYHQTSDLEAVIKQISQSYACDPQIVLWGRSMGAVTSINYLTKNKKFVDNIKVAVLDSPFVNLKEVICQIVNKKIGAPKIFIDLFISYLEPMVYQKARFKISEFDLRKQIDKIKCPLILMASKSDGLVPFQHLQEIYDSHQGKKSIFYLNQSHTDQRSIQTISKIFKAINRYFLAQKRTQQSLPYSISHTVKTGDTIDLQSLRTSQMIESHKLKTAHKNKSSKKISITCPHSSGKLQSVRKTQNYRQSSRIESSTQMKKKKLSLNHLKPMTGCKQNQNSSISKNVKGTVCRPIQLFKTIQKKLMTQKLTDKNNSTINLMQVPRDSNNVYAQQNKLKQKHNDNHRRIQSNFSQISKDNSLRKIISQFAQFKQVKRDARILNILSNNF